jgi:hypothetical protein
MERFIKGDLYESEEYVLEDAFDKAMLNDSKIVKVLDEL